VRLLEVKHPIRFIAASLSSVIALNFVFTAGFVYNNLDRDWAELKKYKHDLDQLIKNDKIKTEQIKHLADQNTKIISHLKLKDEQSRKINDKLNQCLAQKAVKLSYNF